MPSLENRNGSYRVVYRLRGRKYSRSLRTRDATAARATFARLDDTLRRVELGTLAIPDGADVTAFLLSDGNVKEPENKSFTNENVTLATVFDRYLSSLPEGSLELSTLAMLQIHMRHFLKVFGKTFRVRRMQLVNLQEYVDQRTKDKGRRGKRLSSSTIKKELVTLNTIWRWAFDMGIVEATLPKRGIRLPKSKERPSFQTWAEIERKVARGGFSDNEEADLWECMFLTLSEISELLAHVKLRARHPFIYPMFLFAAHTGVRRSEILRSLWDDIDFDSKTITIRERKRVRATLSTRTVPMSPVLTMVLRDWYTVHPGGRFTFCHGLRVCRSKTARSETQPLTRDESVHHFRKTLSSSKWERVRGWHLFRHSFCSNCAAAGVDQRIINAWVGHQTEDMVRRYRHLIPNQQQSAIQQVFGTADAVADQGLESNPLPTSPLTGDQPE